VKEVEEYRYLGVYQDNMDWKCNTEAVNKGQGKLLFEGALICVCVCIKVLHIFFSSGGECILFAVICWGSSIRGSQHI